MEANIVERIVDICFYLCLIRTLRLRALVHHTKYPGVMMNVRQHYRAAFEAGLDYGEVILSTYACFMPNLTWKQITNL